MAGSRMDLFPPQSSEQVVSDMMERAHAGVRATLVYMWDTWACSVLFLGPSFPMGDAVFFSSGTLVIYRASGQHQGTGYNPYREMKCWQDVQLGMAFNSGCPSEQLYNTSSTSPPYMRVEGMGPCSLEAVKSRDTEVFLRVCL